MNTIFEPLRQVYGFRRETVRIIHDPELYQIAGFNRDGAIYLNLEKFERENYANGYLDDEVMGLLSFYFALAHEFSVSLIRWPCQSIE